jgi:hypothetical protein
MTYAHVFEIPGPPELYDALHAEFLKYPAEEMILHLARSTDDGTQVVEVWTSESALGAWMAANGGPAIGAVVAAGWSPPEVTPVPFELRGAVVPSAGFVV